MRRCFSSMIVITLLFAVQPLPAGLSDFSSTKRAQRYKHRTDTIFFSKDLSETAKKITVRVKLKVKEGSVRYRLEDPYGNPKWDEKVEAGDEVDKKDWFNAQRGEWRVVLIFDDATGGYSVKMSTR